MMTRFSQLLFLMMCVLLVGCQTTPENDTKRANLDDSVNATINRFERVDPGLKSTLDNAYGYAVFPEVGKGGLIVGGAYGKGRVIEQGRMVGYADLTQATVGAQAGGETFAEIISFQDRNALERFKANQLAFSANASAVAIKAGKAAAARYDNGVAVFTMPNGGLMLEASVGGQKFTYTANENAGGTTRPAMEKRTVEERTTSGTDTDRKGVKVNVDVDKK